MLGALVLTAIVTLAVAAFALLAPLQSTLEGDSKKIGQGTVSVDKTPLASLPVGPAGVPSQRAFNLLIENFVHHNGATYVVWNDRPNLIYRSEERRVGKECRSRW